MNEEGYKTERVVGYLRSAKLNDSQLEEEEAQIRAYAAQRGYNLIALLREEDISSTTAHRPMLQKAIRSLRTQEVAGVIIPSQAQLASRATDINRLLARLRDYGWVEFIQE